MPLIRAMNAVDRIRRITTAFPGWQVDFESDQITVSRPGGFSAGIDPELARTLSADEIISNIRDNPEFALGESAPRIEHEDTVVQLRIIIKIFKLTADVVWSIGFLFQQLGNLTETEVQWLTTYCAHDSALNPEVIAARRAEARRAAAESGT